MLDDVVQRLSVVQQRNTRENEEERERQLKMKSERGGGETESAAHSACNVGRHCRQRHIDGQKLKFADSVWHWLRALAAFPLLFPFPHFPLPSFDEEKCVL